MSDQHTEYWGKLLDVLKQKQGISNYTRLADYLGLKKGSLSDLRRGRREMSVEIKLKVLQGLGGDIFQSDYENIFPASIRTSASTEIAKIYDPKEGKNLNEDFWIKRIDELKRLREVRSDRALAMSLSISPTMISEVRNGNDGLSTVAKIRILDTLAYTAAENLLLDLLPRRFKDRIKEFQKLRFITRGIKRE